MAKSKIGPKKTASAAVEPGVKHARIELPEVEYNRLKSAARRRLLPVAAYIRQAVMAAIDEDERRNLR
jgi:hypothetical protein